ncbi:Ig-like domain-containing protein [Paenibacillus nasutitermitis]|uniref:Uncharacterized protein n=1 Tax=Paenibacillus nasutitermitis TaxID=1652958 RepID=A0A916ZHR1_9BACL|nr:Ig-like domain-containing protein [Paenibacillus nasutitermitis]GGD98578.1 hypothetical protein GCM10010911_66750 [Paenibacillus nasutitermitis]
MVMKISRKLCWILVIAVVGMYFAPMAPIRTAEASPLAGDDMEDIGDWSLTNPANGAMSVYSGASRVIQGSGSMNFRITDDNDGTNDAVSVSKTFSPQLNLGSQDVLSFWIQSDAYDPRFDIMLQDSDGTVSKVPLSNVVRSAHLPASIIPDNWYQVFWHFKEYSGTVSGGDDAMNYGSIQKLTFASTDGRPANMKSEQVNFYIDDVYFYADSDLYQQNLIDGMESTAAWNATAGASRALSTAQVKQGTSSMKYTVTNNNNGQADYPALYRANVSYNLTGFYEMTYWIKPSQNLTFFNVRITDTDQTSEEFHLSDMFPASGGTLLANKWYKGRILFRDDPGTIVGGNGIMNFDQMKEIVFVTRDSELPPGVNTDIYIDDLQAVKYTDRVTVDAFDSAGGWTTTPGSDNTVNTNNYRDASRASVTFHAPNNNDGIANYYTASKSVSANLANQDVLSFWLLVSEDTEKLVFSLKDADGTANYIRLDSIVWGSQLVPGRWWHIEWPFKTQTDEIAGGNGVMDYSNVTGFEMTVDDNTMVKGTAGNYYSVDNLEAMTDKEWMRSKEQTPMLEPTGNDYAARDFQIGIYNNANVQTEKTLHDMSKHGVDFIVSHVSHRDDTITKNAALAERLGLKIVRQSFPVANNNSLDHAGLSALAANDSNRAAQADPANTTISYLNANELEVYWPNRLQSDPGGDFTYFADQTRMNDSANGVDRRINTHHINYLWYDTGEDHPWYMDWSTLGNYGGFQWTDRLKQTAWRMGKTNATNTQSWSPSNLLTSMSDRIYRHVGQAPLNLDEIADFKDSLWTNFEGGLSGVAFFIWDGDEWANEWNFVDNDGNPMNDRRWAAVTDMSKQIRATEGKPYVELTYPRSFEVVEKGSVAVSAQAVPSGLPVTSVIFEYNDGTNTAWTPIGTASAAPYTVNWNTGGLDAAKKYFVRARAYDGVHESAPDTSYSVSLNNAGGPKVSGTAVSSNATNGASSVTISTAAAGSGKPVAKVQYYVDTVQKPGQGIDMAAADGMFNSISEGATATIAIPPLNKTAPILIDDMSDSSDWSGTAARALESGYLRLDVKNNNNGAADMLTAVKDYGTGLQDLSGLDTLSFWVKDVTNPLSQMQIRLRDNDGTTLEASLPAYYGASSVPADNWKNIRWNFKENDDSISGGNGVFNFDQVKAVEFSIDDSTLPASGALQKIYIDQIRAFAETRWQEQTSPVIYVRAMDNAGNWGPTQSVKINVTNAPAGDTQGPVTVTAGTNPHGITDGLTSFLLTANIDDGINSTGGTRIESAEYFIDAPGANGAGTPMLAVDGGFDSMSESVAASVSAAAWADNSKHTLYIHGRDAAGNWGPFYSETIIKTTAQGPLIQNASASPNPVQGSGPVTIRAIADETDTGWGDIAGGEYFVDTIGFEGSGTPMTALDGIFDARNEQMTAQINTASWSNGYHTVFVHAKDSRGKWGPLKSVTVVKN